MWESIKAVWTNLRNAKFLVETITENRGLEQAKTELEKRFEDLRERHRVLAATNQAHLTAAKMLLKRYGPMCRIPRRFITEVQGLKFESRNREDDYVELRVRGIGAKKAS